MSGEAEGSDEGHAHVPLSGKHLEKKYLFVSWYAHMIIARACKISEPCEPSVETWVEDSHTTLHNA